MMIMKKILVILVVLLLSYATISLFIEAKQSNTAKTTKLKVVTALDIAPAWSGLPVGIALLTQGKRQFIVFYDEQRRMTVASRMLNETKWSFFILPETVIWDSHNYVTIDIDDSGNVHISGNMHCSPLVYFRTNKPYEIDSLERVPNMVGSEERLCTYPHFLRGANNEFIFTYRDGGSGNGNQIYNVYDLKTKVWKRLLDQPLTSGEGQMNAYIHGPIRGSDGFFHICWVWRDTPDCSTNHDLSYARSKDLIHWETGIGNPLNLPLTIKTAEIVDPVPVQGGMLNNIALGFDSHSRPIITYHKFDKAGLTQLYNARLEKGNWKIYQASQWDYRWDFKGSGSIPFEITFGPVQVEADKTLTQSYYNIKHGSGIWRLDEVTLKPIGAMKPKRSFPEELRKVESKTPGMNVNWCKDSGESNEMGITYMLRWESLGVNRDQARQEIPPASMLRLYKFKSD
jgi:hypothetical protein